MDVVHIVYMAVRMVFVTYNILRCPRKYELCPFPDSVIHKDTALSWLSTADNPRGPQKLQQNKIWNTIVTLRNARWQQSYHVTGLRSFQHAHITENNGLHIPGKCAVT